ncbi:HAD family hydrolase [Nocardioides guangzhouensis]|uniref:HAD family hydrolase n=1 Tax=Nocardioides guangzhouensis TaxID=2497878 RepID=A0A4Q4ZF03_9ACTN|nr:HAD-IA family hydrolase [Nocardioides guangzhouensis]RYP86657.1 HAD family hydrolase [Nocardioides guangzhouensis]
MTRYAACLIDVYDTVVSVDFSRFVTSLAERAGVSADDLAIGVSSWEVPVSVGRVTIAEALDDVLRTLGSPADATLIDDLVAADLELLHELAVLHDDTIPFLQSLRASGVRTAFVSNCADNTRPLLDHLGLAALVDELVLSCEVQAAKPDPVIFHEALRRLDVAPEQALFVDDQQRYCDAATALGIAAVRIDRFDGTGAAASLAELTPYF